MSGVGLWKGVLNVGSGSPMGKEQFWGVCCPFIWDFLVGCVKLYSICVRKVDSFLFGQYISGLESVFFGLFNDVLY